LASKPLQPRAYFRHGGLRWWTTCQGRTKKRPTASSC
jgi:hypothetical protein